MPHIIADRVKERIQSPAGTGTLSLLNTVSGYRRFSSVMSSGDTCYYCLESPSNGDWECGLGTYSSNNALSRTSVYSSSNSGTLVNFANRVSYAFISYVASRAIYLDPSGELNLALTTLSDVGLSAPASGESLVYNGSSWANTVITGYTTEEAQDAVGGILADTSSISFAYDDGTPSISASVRSSGVTNDMLATGIDATKLGSGSVSSTELGYLDGVTSSIQTQFGNKADTSVQVIAGTGLSGGGDLSTSRTLNLANTAVTPGSYTLSSFTVDAQGRITAAASGSVDLSSYLTSSVASATYQPLDADLTSLASASGSGIYERSAGTWTPVVIGTGLSLAGGTLSNTLDLSSYLTSSVATATYLPLAGGTLTGDLKFTDATYDIGKSGATRPRDGFFSRNLTYSGQLMAPVGSQYAASIQNSQFGTGTGINFTAAGTFFIDNNSAVVHVGVGGQNKLVLGCDLRFASSIGATEDLHVVRSAADTLALRRSTNAQAFQIHETWSSSTSFGTLQFKANTGAAYQIGSAIGSAGGTNRAITFGHWNTAGTFVGTAGITTAGTTGGRFSDSGGTTDCERFGADSVVGANECLAVGRFATAGVDYATSIGKSSYAGYFSTSLGRCAGTPGTTGGFPSANGFNWCITISTGEDFVAPTANGQFIVAGQWTEAYFGKKVTHATPLDVRFNSTGGSGTNIAGASFTLAGGKGTGTGLGGSLKFQVAPAGSTGSSANALVDALVIDSTKKSTFSGEINLTNASSQTLRIAMDTNNPVISSATTRVIMSGTAIWLRTDGGVSFVNSSEQEMGKVSISSFNVTMQSNTNGSLTLTVPTSANGNQGANSVNVIGQTALSSSVVVLGGGAVNLTGGNGASASAGDAYGGDVVITGGTGYGTGRQGRCVILSPITNTSTDITEIRNSTNAQTFRVAETYTSTTSFGTFQIKANAGAAYQIGSAVGSAGGSNRAIEIGHYSSAGTFTSALSIATTGAATFASTINTMDFVGTNYNLGVGYSTSPSLAFAATALGWTARATHNYSISIGASSASSAANQFTVGDSTNVSKFRFGTGVASVTFDNPLILGQLVSTTGSPTAFTITGAAHTTLTASTEATDVNFNLSRTVQFATGAITTQRAMRIQAPTYSFVGASTITTASTLSISGAPVAGTNATITNAYALNVESGKSQFNSYTQVGGTDSFSSSLSVGNRVQMWASGYDCLIMNFGAGETLGYHASWGSGGIQLQSRTAGFGWSSLSNNFTNFDAAFYSPAANIIEQRRTTAAQTFRVYATYTSSTSYELINIKGKASANFEIGPENGSAGGTLRGMTIGGYSAGTTTIAPWLSFTNTGAATFAQELNCSNTTTVTNANIHVERYGASISSVRFRKAQGTSGSPTQALSADIIGLFGSYGYHDGSAFHTTAGAYVGFVAAENITSTGHGSLIRFNTTPTGSTTSATRVQIESSGVTTFYKLACQSSEPTSTPSGTTQTITLDSGNHQTLTLTSATGTVAVTLTVPTNVSTGTLIVKQHATTPRNITWAVSAGTIKWMGTQPTWSSDAVNDIRIVSWRYDGSVMYLMSTDVAA